MGVLGTNVYAPPLLLPQHNRVMSIQLSTGESASNVSWALPAALAQALGIPAVTPATITVANVSCTTYLAGVTAGQLLCVFTLQCTIPNRLSGAVVRMCATSYNASSSETHWHSSLSSALLQVAVSRPPFPMTQLHGTSS